MSRWRAVLSIVALLAALAGGFVMAISSQLNGLCGNTPLESVASPDGRREAVLFERNCGATTGFSTHVSVIDAGHALPNEPGNAFTAVLADGGSAAPWGGPMAALHWTGENHLVIQPNRWARILTAETEAGRTRITYQHDDQAAAHSPSGTGR